MGLKLAAPPIEARAKYGWRGACARAGQLPKSVLQHRDHEICWHAGLDGQRVLMKWCSPAGNMGACLGRDAPA